MRLITSPQVTILASAMTACRRQPRLIVDDALPDVLPALALVTFARESDCLFLESVCDTNGYGRYSILAIEPVSQVEARADQTELMAPLGAIPLGSTDPMAPAVPVAPGWFGFIPYEFGAELNGVVRDGCDARLRFNLYDTIAVYDHAARGWQIIAADLPESRIGASARVDRFRVLLESAGALGDSPDAAPPANTFLVDQSLTRPQYAQCVGRAKRHIAAGDIYQVNLTQRFTFATDQSPLSVYQRLRRTNPASFAAYIRDDNRTVLSSSPELFLRVDGDRIVTRPIKGTEPRRHELAEDAIVGSRLLASEKNRAELNMIIDLMRNDLGRLCRAGSVRVIDDAEVEVHPTVLHLVGTIEGRLAKGATFGDILRATFPGGSITGCPKIRAMQIIRELEPTPRDVYCGSIGYVDVLGRVNLNIAIRTMLHAGDCIHVYSGGAITADSDADDEYAECMAKAAGMLQAVGATLNSGATHAQPDRQESAI